MLSVATGAVLITYLSSHAINFRLTNQDDRIVWSVEAKSIGWEPAAFSVLCLAMLYTGRIDWVIDTAESMAQRLKGKD